tara:strand:+ start:67 stop:1071 length:1005 start_codon:yes stop_codon:yes gene_type:complete
MSLSEFEIIRKYFKSAELALKKEEILLGIGDDAAILDVSSDNQLVVSTDILVESVHFPATATPSKIATRALLVNLSDLAAMGAQPLCFTMALVLNDSSESWLKSFSEGLAKIAQRYKIALVGGDLSKGPTTIAIQVHGIAKPGKVLRRNAANIGDLIYVTGTLGDGAISLASLGVSPHVGDFFRFNDEQIPLDCVQYFEQAFYEPKPRLDFAKQSAEYINSAIDISDGLIGDLGHICKCSGVGAILKVEDFPYSDSARCCVSAKNRLLAALYGGDDYELCVTVTKKNQQQFIAKANETNTKITCIGEIIEGNLIHYLNERGEKVRFDDKAFQHF